MKNAKNKKTRLDHLVHEQGMAESREKAKRMIMAGLIRVNGEPVFKPGKLIAADNSISRIQKSLFVSRGGEKLDGFFQDYSLEVNGKTCMDIGASTGGFTDCLIKKGAKKVYAVDVGKGLIDWRLRNNPRVTLFEKVNARYLSKDIIPEKCDICVMDVSFISVEKIIPAVYNLLARNGVILALIKPQFEAGRKSVGKKGIVKDINVHKQVIEKIETFSRSLDLNVLAVIPSRVKGSKGNQEYFMLLKKG